MANFFHGTGNSDVFPSTYRTERITGRYTSELNFVNIIKSLSNVESFVIDYNNNTLKIIIGGYYFELRSLTNLGVNLYAGIKVINGYLHSFESVTTTMDNGGFFKGLALNNGGTPDGSTVSLQITDGEGKIINKGFIKELVDSKGNWLDIKKFFGKLADGSIGSDTKPIYLDETDGFKALDATIGSRPGSLPNTFQNIYLKNGEITGGQKITISTSAPGTATGEIGDLWFVIGG